ncbi:hypothetical protein DFP72DRAFT_517746 [Ephemerocybe angulata]|uniref:Uncharacterized protein n=1 Tax=Ephemerocybe angulata TaxID=980116 RepID=A0A8H6HQI3_9AGAR|nr:hypothetical protein DFP72DRAFT_517746 [Tulosesus angulatus]
MLSPHIKMYNDMPNLVDPNSPASFHAAPPGASSGGQPGGFGGGGYGFGGGSGGGGGFFDAFPGASQQRESPWPPTFGPGTPHPNAANLAPGYPWGVGGGGGGPSGYPVAGSTTRPRCRGALRRLRGRTVRRLLLAAHRRLASEEGDIHRGAHLAVEEDLKGLDREASLQEGSLGRRHRTIRHGNRRRRRRSGGRRGVRA